MQTVYQIAENAYQRGKAVGAVDVWFLPAAASALGIEDPTTRQLVQRAAYGLCLLCDPREHVYYTHIVTELARQLPGGLGWGNTVVAPVPDEEAYNRHVVMQAKAQDIMSQGHYKLAIDMLKRCVAYFDTLGAHWLGTVRKVLCQLAIIECIMYTEGVTAAEPLMLETKRTAQRELGARHETTLRVCWFQSMFSYAARRFEQALSICQKTLRLRKEVLGPRHIDVFETQSYIAATLHKLGRDKEALACAMDAFEGAIKVAGPKDKVTDQALGFCMHMMKDDKKQKKQLAALKRRAHNLGCDVDRAWQLCDVETQEAIERISRLGVWDTKQAKALNLRRTECGV